MARNVNRHEPEIRQAYHQLAMATAALSNARNDLDRIGWNVTSRELRDMKARTLDAMDALEAYARGLGWEL